MMPAETINWDMLAATWGERWAWTLLHSLWQDGLLTIGLWIILRLLPARCAERRYSAALAAFTLAAMSPFVTWAWLADTTSTLPQEPPVPVEIAQAADAPVSGHFSSGQSSHHVKTSGQSPGNTSAAAVTPKEQSAIQVSRIVVPGILAVWGLGVLTQLVRTVRDLSATRALLRGDSVLSAAVQASLVRVVDLLQLRRRFQAVVSATQAGPFVFGLWKPTLVLPAALIAGLTPDQLEAVLLHELAHLRRYDDVVNFVQLLVEAVFFFNPALKWISRELRRERETSCDARAVACLSSPLPLAEALARVAEGWTPSGPLPVLAPGFANETEPGVLLDRVRRILSPDDRPRLRLSWMGLAATIVLVGVLVGALEQATSWSVGLAKKMLSPAERIAAVAEAQKNAEPQDPGDPDAKFVVSGTIRAEEGGQLPERGSLHSWSRRETAGSTSSVGSSHNQSGSAFSVSLQPGQCWLIYSTEDYAPVIRGPFRGKGGQTLDGVEMIVKRGASGTVRVVDQQGRPVAKANIVASPDWGNGFWIGPAVPQTTDENGFWKSEHLADVPYRVSVRAAGFTPLDVSESYRITKLPLVITLDPAIPILGIVVDAAGKPVENASLRVVSEKRGNHNRYHGDSGNAIAQTRADGKFELDELAPDTEYSVLIDAGDRGQAALANVRAGMEQIRVDLQRKLVLAGEVRADRRQAAADGTMTIECLSIVGETVWRRMTAKLDADGRFRFDGLFAGRYQLSIGTHQISGRLGDSITDLVVDLAELERTSLARDIEVRFTEDGKLVVPAGHVTAQMEVLDSRGKSRFGGPTPIVDGVVRLRMKTPGTLRLVAQGCLGYWFADISTEVPVGADVFQAQFDVAPAGAIRVKIVPPDGQQNVKGSSSAAVQFQHNTPQGMRVEVLSQNAVSADEVVLAPVPLDTECLVSATQGFRIVHAPLLSLDGAGPVRDLTLQLPKAVDAVVRVESMDGKTLSQIPIEVSYEPPSRPQGRASGDLSPGGNSWGGDRQTDRNGQTILAGMPENGVGYTVIAHPKRDWQVDRTEVQTDGGVTVLKLERGNVIEGRVIDKKSGRPVPGIDVRAWPADRLLGGTREFSSEAPTDSNGNFRFSNLPARTVKLIAWGTSLPSEPEVEPGQEELVTLTVRLPD